MQLQHLLAYRSNFFWSQRPDDTLATGTHVDELKDAKAKAGSAVNRSPDLTGDIGTLGAHAKACSECCVAFSVSWYLFHQRIILRARRKCSVAAFELVRKGQNLAAHPMEYGFGSGSLVY